MNAIPEKGDLFGQAIDSAWPKFFGVGLGRSSCKINHTLFLRRERFATPGVARS
jgi:hypothetical protein